MERPSPAANDLPSGARARAFTGRSGSGIPGRIVRLALPVSAFQKTPLPSALPLTTVFTSIQSRALTAATCWPLSTTGALPPSTSQSGTSTGRSTPTASVRSSGDQARAVISQSGCGEVQVFTGLPAPASQT